VDEVMVVVGDQVEEGKTAKVFQGSSAAPCSSSSARVYQSSSAGQ